MPSEKLTSEKLHALGDYLQGTASSIQAGLTAIDLEPDDFDMNEIESQLLDVECEMCQGCGWWFECGELAADNDDDTGFCEDCRE